MMVSSSSPPYPIKQKRCPNGTRRNKKTGECEKNQNNSKKKTKNRMPLKKYKISC